MQYAYQYPYFLFRNLIDEKVTNDIATTQGYLSQIKDNTVTEAKIQARCVEVENQVNTKLQSLEAEIKILSILAMDQKQSEFWAKLHRF